MNRYFMVAIVLGAALLMPTVLRAHEGHDHTVMGIVSSIDGANLMVKATDGKMVMVMMDAKTKITQGKAVLDVKALKVGDRVVASGAEDKGMISAKTVKVGAADAAPLPRGK